MNQSDIQVGHRYSARISGRIVTVRVDAIRRSVATSRRTRSGLRERLVFDVTNMATGRKITFRSAQKFRGPVAEPTEEDKRMAEARMFRDDLRDCRRLEER